MRRRLLATLLLAGLMSGHATELLRPWIGESYHRCVCNQRVCICFHGRKGVQHHQSGGAAAVVEPNAHHSHSAHATSSPAQAQNRPRMLPAFGLQDCDSGLKQAVTAAFVYLLPVPVHPPEPLAAPESVVAPALPSGIQAPSVDPPPPRSSFA